jgi:hypothetical protein
MKIAVLEKKVEENSHWPVDQEKSAYRFIENLPAEKDFEMAQLNTKLSDMEVDLWLKSSL